MALRILSLLLALVAALATAAVALINNLSLFSAGGMVALAAFGGYIAALVILAALIVMWWRPHLAQLLLLIALVMGALFLAAATPEYAKIAVETGKPFIVYLLPGFGALLLTAAAWFSIRRVASSTPRSTVNPA